MLQNLHASPGDTITTGQHEWIDVAIGAGGRLSDNLGQLVMLDDAEVGLRVADGAGVGEPYSGFTSMRLLTLCHTCHKGLDPHENLKLFGMAGMPTDDYLAWVERYRRKIFADFISLTIGGPVAG